jgi:hypothetical protein
MNSKFQLFLDTSSPELFSKATSELGTIFYKCEGADADKEEVFYQVVYFSGSRIARFVGVPTEQIMKLCEICGFPVDNIEIDEVAGTVRIVEKETKP